MPCLQCQVSTDAAACIRQGARFVRDCSHDVAVVDNAMGVLVALERTAVAECARSCTCELCDSTTLTTFLSFPFAACTTLCLVQKYVVSFCRFSSAVFVACPPASGYCDV